MLRNINLSFFPGAKIGVIGHNGSGKSSLLKIMAGLDDEFDGVARLSPGYTVGYLPQEPHLDPSKDVRGNVMDGVGDTVALQEEYDAVLASYADPDADYEKIGARQAELEAKMAASGNEDVDRTVDIAMDALRCPPGDSPVDNLSGGERRRVALARILLSKPDLLLLDEPTNHLDAESVAWLERTLKDYAGTVVAITHDRYFLDNVAQWILELDRGRGYPVRRQLLGLARAEAGPPRGRGQLGHEAARDAQARARVDPQLTEGQAVQGPGPHQGVRGARQPGRPGLGGRLEKLEIAIPPGKRLGDVVIEFDDVSKAFGDRLLIDDLSFKLPPAGIVGVIGANGAGKTTLFKMITGSEKPDDGDITIGKTVELSYVDQDRDVLDDDKTVYEEITGGVDNLMIGKREIHGRAYVSSFNFKGSDQQTKVGLLSGGERNRVLLARKIKEGGNVLLLDEPTNDLDVDTLRALEDALETFPGCAVVISHDRWFLDRLATHVLAFEGDSQVRWFEGNFTEYEEWRRREFGIDATQPHRLKYKPITRH